ncbi:MAG: hypothetical protein JWO38_3390 [Gemmataceae bacterium]|nr:hypothetical protein [Gemmataceae bacterium]
MNWPLPQDFNEAVQNPANSFSDPDLKAGRPAIGAQGLPLPRSGNFADVYQVRGPDGRDWAAKCFTRQVFGLGERYAKVAKALAGANLPFGVGFTFLPEGILVRGEWRPVVKMEWVEGFLLNQFVRDNAGRPGTLIAIAQMWGKLCRRLREVGIAHGDLQHGNVLLVPGARPGAFSLKLIDYDGMYTPALANTPSGEAGHPNFQHPARISTRAYSPDLDRFPHLVVATALKALEVCGPAVWDRYDTGDNLLFVEDDFRAPAKSLLMRTLWDSGDPALQALVGRLATACGKPIPRTPWLDQIAPAGQPIPLDAEAARDATAALGLAAPVVAVPAEVPPAPAEPAATGGAEAFAGLDLDDSEPTPPKAAARRVGTRVLELETPEPARNPGTRRTGTRELEPEPRKKSRALIIGVVAGVVLLAGAGVGGVLLLGGKKSTETAQAGRPEDPKQDQPNPQPASGSKQPKDPDPGTPTRPTPMPVNPGGTGGEDPPNINPAPTPKNPGPLGQLDVKKRWTANVPAGVFGHLAFDRDGRGVVVGSSAKSSPVLAFRSEDGARLPGFAGHAGAVHGLVGLDRARIASYDAANPRAATVWDVQTGQSTGQIPFPPCPPPAPPPGGGTVGLARGFVSPDGRYAATSGPGTFRLEEEKKVFEPGPFRVAEVATGKVVLATDWLDGRVFFTADSSRILLAENGGRFRWFQLPSGQSDGEWRFPGSTLPDPQLVNWTIDVSGDGGVILYSGPTPAKGGGVFALDGRTGKVIRDFGTRCHIRLGAVSPDGRLVAAARKDVPPDGVPVVDLVDLVDNRQTAIRLDLGSSSTAVPAFSPDGRALALHQGQKLLMVDIDGRLVAAGPKPKDPVVVPPTQKPDPKPRDPIELKPRWTFETNENGNPVLAIDPETESVYIGSTVLHLRTGATRPGFEGVGQFSRIEAYPLDRGRVATHGRGDPVIRVWVAKTGRPAPKTPQIAVPPIPGDGLNNSVNLSPNGRYLVVSSFGRYVNGVRLDAPVQVFDTTTGKPLLKLDWKGGTSHFTTDSSRLLLAETVGRFRWFKLPTGQPDGEWSFEPPVPGFPHQVTGMSGDGRVLGYTGSGKDRNPQSRGAFVLDGKSGQVLFPCPSFANSPVRVSADGRLAAYWRTRTATDDMYEVAVVATGAVVARAAAPFDPTKVSTRRYAVSPDGRHFALYDSVEKKGYLFDLPAGGPAGPTPAGPAVARAPVPTDDALEKAHKIVREALKEDFARKQPAEKKLLAQKLMTLADETPDDPAGRYIMLREAGDLAVEAGDPALAAAAVDGLARWYEVDALGLKATALEKLSAGSTGPAALRAVYDAAAAAADAAFGTEDYAAAARFAAVAGAASRKGSLGLPLTQDMDLLAAQAKKWADGLAAIKPAREALKTAPDDPAANLAVGRYRCFVQGKWEEGLKHLAKGSHPGLKAAAEADLAAQAGTADLKVADAWREYAAAAPEADKWAADGRGRYWDVRVAAGLTGLSKAKAEARLGFTAGGIAYRPGLLAELQSRQGGVVKVKKTRVDPTLDFATASFADPTAGAAEVTAKWTGAVVPPRGGLYKLTADSNDPVRVRVDGKVVIDTTIKGAGRPEATVLLAERPTSVVVDYTAPNAAAHALKLRWAPHGGDDEPVPAECLFHDQKAEAASGK